MVERLTRPKNQVEAIMRELGGKALREGKGPKGPDLGSDAAAEEMQRWFADGWYAARGDTALSGEVATTSGEQGGLF